MRFEGRELKTYAEPVSLADLEVGSVYFAVGFVDEAKEVPTVEALVYLGRGLDEKHPDKLFFQDAESYRDGVRLETALSNEDGVFFTCDESAMKNIFEFERALDVLMRCSLRRQGKKRVG